jgi:H+/Cl- antiporter ClcA
MLAHRVACKRSSKIGAGGFIGGHASMRIPWVFGDGHDLDTHACGQFGSSLIIFTGREPVLADYSKRFPS